MNRITELLTIEKKFGNIRCFVLPPLIIYNLNDVLKVLKIDYVDTMIKKDIYVYNIQDDIYLEEDVVYDIMLNYPKTKNVNRLYDFLLTIGYELVINYMIVNPTFNENDTYILVKANSN